MSKTIFDEYTKLNEKLKKIIESKISNLLEDFEKQYQEFYIEIGNRTFIMNLQKWSGRYIWDVNIKTEEIPLYAYSAKFKIDEYTGKPIILQLYRNDIINVCIEPEKYDARFYQ